MVKFVSMFTTDTPYEREVEALLLSLIEFDLPHAIHARESRGSWAKNCQMKADVIYEELQRTTEDIVWTDADSVILRYPELFNRLDCDIAVHILPRGRGWEVLSGTVYFANNDRVRDLVLDWIDTNKQNDNWDQLNLQIVLPRHQLRIGVLPAEYCKIFDRGSQKCNDPVIVHYQASRRYKQVIT